MEPLRFTVPPQWDGALLKHFLRREAGVTARLLARLKRVDGGIQLNGKPVYVIEPVHTGDVVELSQDSCKVADHVQAGAILVDGLGVGDVGNIVLRGRQNLAQNGIIVVVLTLEKYSNQLLSGPDIVSRGFVYVRESEDLLEETRKVVEEAVQDCLDRHVSDWGKIKNIIRDSLSDFLWKKMKRNPMILPIIMEV